MIPSPSQVGRVIIGALVIPWVTAQAQAQARADEPPNYFVLAVGINKYKSDRVPDLRGAVNDAKSIIGVVRDQGSRVRFQELLDQDATHDNCVAALALMEKVVEPGEVVVIFLSGHGRRFMDRWELLCHDFDPPPPGSALPGATLSDVWLLNAVQRVVDRGHLVVLAIDACHAGQVAQTTEAEKLLLARGASQGGLILMTSCVPTQTSKDGVDNGQFTKALVEALRGLADLDEDGNVTLKELELYLPWRMRRLTRGLPKYPGIGWSEQDVLCVGSFRVSEKLAVARTNGLKPMLPSDTSRLVAPFTGLPDQSRIPVGLWSEVRTYPTGNASTLKSIYLLEVRANGTYNAVFKDPVGGVEQSTGLYQPASPGFMATLSYGNGYDKIIVKSVDEANLEIDVFPSGSFQSQAGKFILHRVAENQAKP